MARLEIAPTLVRRDGFDETACRVRLENEAWKTIRIAPGTYVDTDDLLGTLAYEMASVLPGVQARLCVDGRVELTASAPFSLMGANEEGNTPQDLLLLARLGFDTSATCGFGMRHLASRPPLDVVTLPVVSEWGKETPVFTGLAARGLSGRSQGVLLGAFTQETLVLEFIPQTSLSPLVALLERAYVAGGVIVDDGRGRRGLRRLATDTVPLPRRPYPQAPYFSLTLNLEKVDA